MHALFSHSAFVPHRTPQAPQAFSLYSVSTHKPVPPQSRAAGFALTGSVDAAPRTTAVTVRTRVTEKPAARVTVAAAAAAFVGDAPSAERTGRAAGNTTAAGAHGSAAAHRAAGARRATGPHGSARARAAAGALGSTRALATGARRGASSRRAARRGHFPAFSTVPSAARGSAAGPCVLSRRFRPTRHRPFRRTPPRREARTQRFPSDAALPSSDTNMSRRSSSRRSIV